MTERDWNDVGQQAKECRPLKKETKKARDSPKAFRRNIALPGLRFQSTGTHLGLQNSKTTYKTVNLYCFKSQDLW